MTPPTPAIVPQSAVSPLPRWALWLLCAAYVLPGYVGRNPWKSADISAFGYMLELAHGRTPWLTPLLGGLPPETDGLLAYWLGALAVQWAPAWLTAELAVRLPFATLLVVALVATWYAVYYLARSPGAQPVAFAFGGEAKPTDYARTIADGALLALIACLGLAQLSHEVTSYVVQLACTALLFFGIAALPYHTVLSSLATLAGLIGLTLAGAPAVAAMFGLGGLAVLWLAPSAAGDQRLRSAAVVLVCTVAAALLGQALGLWGWRLVLAEEGSKEWQSLARLFLWFGWPAWPLALWTLWRWRQQIFSLPGQRHLWLPLWFILVAVAATLTTLPADRALLLSLPAMVAMAAFALPTLRRSVGALIDWFTLLFFTASALTIWVIWIAMQTGFPAKPAANVAKLAPGFVPEFSAIALIVALAATLAWAALVWWRAARNRTPLWRSLVLPAGGATLGWLLLMTLWLPLLDFARSYVPQVQSVQAVLGSQPGCVQTHGLSRAQFAALQYHGRLHLEPRPADSPCEWLIADISAWPAPLGAAQELPAAALPTGPWQWTATVPRPTDKNDHLLVFRRNEPAPR